MLCYRLTRLVVYGLCVCITKIVRERERERERVVYWRVCTVHNGIGGVHFTSVWVRRPNGFGQDQWDLLKFGTRIMLPCKSPAQTLYPHQQQPQQQEETRGRGPFGNSI